MSHPKTPRKAAPRSAWNWFLSRRDLWPWLALLPVALAATVALRAEGRLWWCACGRPSLWSSDAWGSHNSQHLFDPYAFTHVLHGILLYGLLAWCCPRVAMAWRLWLTVAVETLWEVIENTNFVIERFRAATASLEYEGDTVANVHGDVLACGLGFVLARWLGFRWSAAVIVATEVVLLVWIRDNLTITVVMLFYPIEAIKAWQMGQ